MAKYNFVGQGLGVIGLPHEITAEQAAQYEADYEKAVANFRQKAAGQDEAEVSEMDLKNALAGHPWLLLQAALENGNYQETKAGRPPKDKKADESPKDVNDG